jgi:hypothetical protein
MVPSDNLGDRVVVKRANLVEQSSDSVLVPLLRIRMALDAPVVARPVAAPNGGRRGDECVAGRGRVAVAADVALQERGAPRAAEA